MDVPYVFLDIMAICLKLHIHIVLRHIVFILIVCTARKLHISRYVTVTLLNINTSQSVCLYQFYEIILD